MFLNYFTEDAYDKLYSDVSENLEKYVSKTAWVNDYFGGDGYYKTSTGVNVATFSPYFLEGKKSDSQKSKEDLNNVRMMYDAFKSLTPLQASNKYMWSYLCHCDEKCRKYIIDRWLTNNAKESTIKTRFFVRNSGELLNDNALSRLWWYGYLTYDEDNSNHYALTEILLTNQTICTDVIDTMNRMNFNRIKGVLLAIKDFKEIIGENEGITDYVRSANKFLNHYAANTTLELLEPEEIKELYLDKLVNTRKSFLEEKNKVLTATEL